MLRHLGHELGGLVEPADEFGGGGSQFVGVVVAGLAERGEEVGGAAGRAAVEVGSKTVAIPKRYPNRSGCGALLPRREPLNTTVESATRRQNGQMDGVIRRSIRAAACRPARSSTITRSIASTGSSVTQ